jgi:glycosyltransferase involved in cell wall biosynthesis
VHSSVRRPLAANAPPRGRGNCHGLFFDEFAPESAWIREEGSVRLPPFTEHTELVLRGEFRRHPEARGIETGPLGAEFKVNGRPIAHRTEFAPGPFEVRFTVEPAAAAQGVLLSARLFGTGSTNFLAWLGRITTGWPGANGLQRFRHQHKNRQLRLLRIETAEGETVFDFAHRDAPLAAAFVRRHVRLGLNVAGFLTADMGIGESARCMVRAADAAGLPVAAIELKLPCKNPRGDDTLRMRLQEDNPHAVNVVHFDPPAGRDLDHHHPSLRRDKYNIGYWAWELPEFPDDWVGHFQYFDEIWCPSEFARAAIAAKSPVPVMAMPHSVSFARPADPPAALRARFGLPPDLFLFLFLYDLNSYSARKNPGAVLDAFRASGLAGHGAALVIKTHNTAGNETDLARLRTAVADLPGTTLIVDTFTHEDVYRLEAACDCFVSLHRSEGFGFGIAEAMFLGKPVIATDWSATAEYLNATNGCPVRAKTVILDRSHGPYAKGQTWAEPDANHAAEWMRLLASDRALCARLGAAARATVETSFAPEAIGARYRHRLEAIASW